MHDLFPEPAPKKAPRISVRRLGKTKPRNVGVRRKTGGAPQVLENAGHCLAMTGFHIFDNPSLYRAIAAKGTLPPRYFVKGYPHLSLYGTPGKKEGFISHEGIEYIVEAKYQSSSGSVDEKIPYLWHHFLASPVSNWIACFDGAWCKSKRGLAAIDWLRELISEQCPPGRQFIVLVGSKELREFFTARFRDGAA